jgi:hypothetical protein
MRLNKSANEDSLVESRIEIDGALEHVRRAAHRIDIDIEGTWPLPPTSLGTR